GERLQQAELFKAQRSAVLEALAAYHKEHPLESGARPERLHAEALAELGPEAYETLLRTLEQRKDIAAEQDRFRLPSFAPILDEAAKLRLDALVKELDAKGPIEEAELLDRLKAVGSKTRALLQYVQDQGMLQRMEGGLYLSRGALARVLAGCRAELAEAAGL